MRYKPFAVDWRGVVDYALRSVKEGRIDVSSLHLSAGRIIVIRREPDDEPKRRGREPDA